MKIGFSTGSIALGDVWRGVDVAKSGQANAIELSALREEELDPLLQSLDALQKDLRGFVYISFHAPSKREKLTESEFIAKLKPVALRGWAIIVHPDVISDFSLWKGLGAAVCIENMDKRKRVGRTAAQLKRVFEELPGSDVLLRHRPRLASRSDNAGGRITAQGVWKSSPTGSHELCELLVSP